MSLILHDNVIEGITPTATNEMTDFEGVNVNNWLLYNSWKPGVTGDQSLTFDLGSAKSVDSFAIYGHNLGSEGSPEENLFTWSEEFDHADWAKINCSITADNTTAPDGTLTADKMVENTAAGVSHILRQGVGTVESTTYTLSIYVKAAGRNIIQLGVSIVGGAQITCTLTGAGSASVVTGTVDSFGIEAKPNDWYRCHMVYTETLSSGNRFHEVYLDDGSGTTYTGDGTSGVFVWGAHIAVGAETFDYVKTTSAAIVARCVLLLQHSSDNSAYSTAFLMLPADGVRFKTFTSQSKRYWKVRILNCTVDALISVVAFGAKTDLPEGMDIGFEPPVWGEVKNINSVSVNGNFLGRSNQPVPIKMRLKQSHVTGSFIRGDWATFIEHAQALPFFFSWDETNQPGETVYAWTDKSPRRPRYTTPTLLAVDLPILALR